MTPLEAQRISALLTSNFIQTMTKLNRLLLKSAEEQDLVLFNQSSQIIRFLLSDDQINQLVVPMFGIERVLAAFGAEEKIQEAARTPNAAIARIVDEYNAEVKRVVAIFIKANEK